MRSAAARSLSRSSLPSGGNSSVTARTFSRICPAWCIASRSWISSGFVVMRHKVETRVTRMSPGRHMDAAPRALLPSSMATRLDKALKRERLPE